MYQQKKKTMENFMTFLNIESIMDVTMDHTMGRNNLMVTTYDSTGKQVVLVITKEKFAEMNLMVNEQIFIQQLNNSNN